MPVLLLDTHAWIWEVSGGNQLTVSTRREIDDAAIAGQLWLCSISFWEISMLAFRGKIRLGAPITNWIDEAIARSHISVQLLNREIALEAGALPGGFRSDPADMIIVATARVTGAMLITRDRPILDYAAAGYLNALAA